MAMDGTFRYANAGGPSAASGGATTSIWQITAGLYALWVDFNIYVATGGDGEVRYKPGTALTLTSAVTATKHLNDSNLTLDSGALIQSGFVALPSTDAPTIVVSSAISSDWVRGNFLPPARTLLIWHGTANKVLGVALRICEARVPDHGMSRFGPRPLGYR